MASPIGGTNQGNGLQNLQAQIRQWIKEELDARARGGIGLHVDGATGNLIIDQGEIQSGNYAAGSTGWVLLPNGNAEFNALTLRAGIIGNDALTNPVVFGSVGGSISNFAVTTTHTIFGSQNITVPAGFTQATILAMVDTTIYNTGSADYLYIQGNIGGVAGGTSGVSVGGGSYNGREASAIRTLTGLTGGSTIAVGATIFTQSTTIAASASNIANINAIALFLR